MSMQQSVNQVASAMQSISEILAGNKHIDTLRTAVKTAPITSGVYRWLDEKGNVIYVGKAKNIRNRLKSYISPAEDATLGPWKRSMLRSLADVDITITSNELEALVLETNLIKEIRPKYNVLMKDDKNYVYVKITVQKVFPDVSVVRNMDDDKAKYFGPFVSSFETKRTLEMVHTVFPFLAEKRTLDTLNRMVRDKEDVQKPLFTTATLGIQIGKHCRLGMGDYSMEQYVDALEQLKKFLRGDRKHIVEQLHIQMQEAATEKKFEKAAKLRDTLAYISSLEEKQIVSDTSGENTDYIGTAVHRGYSQIVLMKERDGRLIAEQSFSFKGESDEQEEVLQSFVPQFYSKNPDIPEVVVVGIDIPDRGVLEEWLTQMHGKKVEIRVPERGKKQKLLELAERNAEEKVKQQEAKWESVQRTTEEALSELQEMLHLSQQPKRIEGYDISHLGGQETVGSMVVIKNGKAANDQYRSFTIRTLQEGDIDDYKSLEETLKRRLLHLVRDTKIEEKKWNAKGIKFGKSRKKELERIQEIHKENADDISDTGLELPQFLVARLEDEIVGFCRIQGYKGGYKELKSVWVKPEYSKNGLGNFLIRKKVHLHAKEKKIYSVIRKSLEEFYASIGFRHVHTSPGCLAESIQEYSKKKDEDIQVMVYNFSDHKPDLSLRSQPDLLVIDGGKGQLRSVVGVLQKLELDIPVIGLAKREEEVFLPGNSVPTIFRKDSQAKFMLIRLRNEAHRFANKLRESKGLKKAVHSALDDVSGIGEVTKKELLKKYKSATGVKEASDDDLLEIVNQGQLDAIRNQL